jgi:hypothetical protein
MKLQVYIFLIFINSIFNTIMYYNYLLDNCVKNFFINLYIIKKILYIYILNIIMNEREYVIVRQFEHLSHYCFHYVEVMGPDGKNYIVKMFIKDPIANIIGLILNGYDIESMVTFKPTKPMADSFKYSRGLYINSGEFVYCSITPQARKLDLQIKTAFKEKIEREGLGENIEYTKYLEELLPIQVKFDFDKLLENDYKYYYHLYRFFFENYDRLISKLTFEELEIIKLEFIQFIEDTPIVINTIEEYIEEINKIIVNDEENIHKNMEQYNFIRCSENFIFVPAYNHIPSISDIILLHEQNQICPEYCNFIVKIFYRYTYEIPINSIIDVGDIIEENADFLNTWLNMLEEIKNGTFDYFKILFGVKDIKTQLSVDNPEIIDGIEKDINIWTSVHPVRKGFYFEARNTPEGYGFSETYQDYMTYINIYEVEQYSILGILNKLNYYVISKKKYVPRQYYDTNTNNWKMADITIEMIREFVKINREDISLNIGKKMVPLKNSKKLYIPPNKRIVYDKKKSPMHHLGGIKKYKIINTGQSNMGIKKDIVKKNINKTNIGGSLKFISRTGMINLIKNIKWDVITQNDCILKISGHVINGSIKNFYVLWIDPHKTIDKNISKILNEQIKKIYEKTFINSVKYDLYLYIINKKIKNIAIDAVLYDENNYKLDEILSDNNNEILSDNNDEILSDNNDQILSDNSNDILSDEIISDNNDDDKILPLFLKKKQNVDEKYEFLKVKLSHDIRKILNKVTLDKFLIEGEKSLSCDNIFNGIQLEVYTKACRTTESFPRPLIDELFDFTRFLLVTDKDGNNPEILNSAEIRETGLENINKGPVESCDKSSLHLYKKFSMMAIIISPEQKINYNISDNREYINSLKKMPKLGQLLVDMINYVYTKKNFFKLTSYFFPWRKGNRERIYNIFDLNDSDMEYLVKLINNVIDTIIIFFKKLNIKKLSNINVNNIEIYFHYPNGNADIHAHFKIYSDINILDNFKRTGYIHSTFIKNEINKRRRFKYNYDRLWDIRFIFNILKINKNIFEKMEYTTMFKKSSYMKILECKILEPIDQHGGTNNDKFIKWADTYLNYKKIFKNYILEAIFIDFEIILEKKPIRMNSIYNEFIKCFNFEKYNIVNNNFYNKMFDGYINLSKSQENINIVSKILFKKFDKILMISKTNIYINQFYIDDNLNFINNDKYDIYYNLIIIKSEIAFFNNIPPFNPCNSSLYFKKNITALIWSLKHLNKDGCITLLIREFLTPFSTDLLLLLQQFCKINIYYNLIMSDAISLPLYIICTNFKNINSLIKHLEKILTFNINPDTGFFKINKIIMGDIEKFYKKTLKVSLFLFNRKNNYKDCFKNDNGELEIMSLEIEHYIIIKAMSLISKIYLPKPENMNYIASLLDIKKIKINGKYIDISYNINKEEGMLIYKLIKHSKAKKILELGMGYGLSSLIILQSLKYFNNKYNEMDSNYKLVSIDPYQKTFWKEIGMEHLKKAHLIAYHKLKEENTYIFLPELIKKKKLYDIVFINSLFLLNNKLLGELKEYQIIKKNGWSEIDYILNDILNSYHLLKIKGYLIINNSLNPGISEILKYIEMYYPFLKKIETDVKSMTVYLKIDKDDDE